MSNFLAGCVAWAEFLTPASFVVYLFIVEVMQ
jgi:hypothetical protein